MAVPLSGHLIVDNHRQAGISVCYEAGASYKSYAVFMARYDADNSKSSASGNPTVPENARR